MITRPTDRTLFQPLAEFEKALQDFSRKNKFAYELYLQTPELQRIRPDPKRATDRLKTEKTFLEKYRRFYEPLQSEVDLFFQNLAISRQNGHNEWVDFNATMIVIWDRATRRLFYQFKRNGRFPEQMSAALSLGKATVVIHNFTRTGVLGVNFNAYPMLERQDKCQSRLYLEMAEEEEFKKMYRISENEIMFAGFPESEKRRVLLEQNEKMRQKYENESLYYMLCKSWAGHVKNWETRFRRPFPGTPLLTVHRTTTSNGNAIPLITLDDNEQSTVTQPAATVTQGMTTSSTDSSEGSSVDVEMTSSRETSKDVMEVEDVVGERNQTPSESASDDHDESSENLFNEFFIPNSEDVASPRRPEDVTMVQNPQNPVSEFPTTSDSQPDEDLFGEFFQTNSEDVTMASESPMASGIGQEDVSGDFRRISIDEDRIQGGQDLEDVKPPEDVQEKSPELANDGVRIRNPESSRHQNPEISEDVKEESPEVVQDLEDVQRGAPESPRYQNPEFLEDVKVESPEDDVKMEYPESLEEPSLQNPPTTSEFLEVPRHQDSYPEVIVQRPEDVPVLSEVPRHQNPESSEDVEVQKAKSPEVDQKASPEAPEDVEMESSESPESLRHQNSELAGDVPVETPESSEDVPYKAPESPHHQIPESSESPRHLNPESPEVVREKTPDSSEDVEMESLRHQNTGSSEDIPIEAPESSEDVNIESPESSRHLTPESSEDVEIQKAESSESPRHLYPESPEDVQRPEASSEDVETPEAKSPEDVPIVALESPEDVKIESPEVVQEKSPESPRHLNLKSPKVVQRPEDVPIESQGSSEDVRRPEASPEDPEDVAPESPRHLNPESPEVVKEKSPESPRHQNPPEDVKTRESESPESEEGDPFHLNLLGTPRTSQDISEPSSRLLVNPAPDVDVPEDVKNPES